SDPNLTDADLHIINADGTGQTNLTSNNIWEFGPAWSPDGTKIAFESFDSAKGRYQIHVIDADGSNETNLSNSTSDESYPTWSPDGTKIAFRWNCCGNEDIYVINADGSNRTQLTTNSAIDSFPSWQPISTSDTDGDGISNPIDV